MLAAIGGLLLALAPDAAPPAVELRWDAPAGCPPQAALEQEVAALLADHAPPPRAVPPRLSFRVERRGATWMLHGEITSEGLTGKRELSAPSCQDLLAAAALLAAIVVDPVGLPSVPEPPAPEPVVEAPPAEAPPTRDVPPASPARPSPPRPAAAPAPPRVGAFLTAAAGLGLGALPAPAGLLRVLAGVRGRAWSLGLVQDVWLPREGAVPASPEVGGRFWLWSAGARGCGILRAGPVEIPLCAAVSLGVMTGKGTGAVTVSRRQSTLWGGVTAGPALRVPLARRLGLVLAADLLVIFARPTFEIAGRGAACCDDRVGGQLTGGLELRLP